MSLPAERSLPDLLETHPELAGYPSAPESLPPGELAEGSYAVRYARSPAELDELARLRFRVFNLELNEGLDESYLTGRDLDPYDAQCHHLIVIHRPSGAIIGTYRIQTTPMAESRRGFYTGSEFDLSKLPREILDEAVEVGRACIAREHRLKPVLFLLWKGLALYMAHNRKRWLFGPCSLTTQDPWDGKRALDQLARRGLLRDDVEVTAQPGFECVWTGEDPEPERAERLELPPLFEIYLRYAGRVAGPPVIDRQFKTIDFFVLFDVERLSPRARRLFFG
jgi:putative hemolysin